jgi:O-succinylhomoserine sulfhydrylase
VRYPFLTSHPQYDLAKRQMSGGGTVVTFELVAPEGRGKQRAFDVLDKLRLIDISNNLGDAKSLITHPASTTHRQLRPHELEQAGITPDMVRLSIGLEHPDDLIEDLDQALSTEDLGDRGAEVVEGSDPALG